MKFDMKALAVLGGIGAAGAIAWKKFGIGKYAPGDQVLVSEGGGLKRVTITDWDAHGDSFRGQIWAPTPDGGVKPLPITQGFKKSQISRKADAR